MRYVERDLLEQEDGAALDCRDGRIGEDGQVCRLVFMQSLHECGQANELDGAFRGSRIGEGHKDEIDFVGHGSPRGGSGRF